jgi:serine/threonine-protein kinase
MPFDFLVVEGGHTRALPFPAAHFVIGSDPACELRFASNQVQPRHAQIEVTGDRAFLTDLTGRGLTWVNGMPLEKGELQPGMLVRFGRVELMVRFERSRVPAAPGPRPSTDEAVADPPIDATAHRPTPFREPSVAPQAPSTAPALGDEVAPPTAGGSRPLSIGSIIDERYHILARVAAGGMGEVYKAQHVELGKLMAIKVMRRVLSQDAEFVARFKREAIATSGIGQINIVDISDFGRTEDGRFYFAMEYLDGVTLASLVHREGPQPIDRVLAIAVQMARALAAAHSLGVVHRDLKPENVMLLQRHGQRDFVKVVDFGVAKVPVAAGAKGHTAIGMVVGTPQYMSPEQAKAISVDARSDIYSMGLIIYELLAGRPTFDAETPASLMVKQVTEAPAPLQLGDDAPPELGALIDAMLAKSPDDRPQTMTEVVEKLEELLGIRGVRASLGDLPRVSTPTRTSPLRTPSLVGQPSTKSARSAPRAQGARTAPARPESGVIVARPEPSGPEGVVTERPVTERPVGTDLEETPDFVDPSLTSSRTPLYVGLAVVALALVGAGVWWSGREPAPVTPPPQEVDQPPQPPQPTAVKDGLADRPQEGTSPAAVVPPAKTLVRLQLNSTPAGAEVYEGEVLLGTTPLTLSRPSARSVELRVALDGYRPVKRRFAFTKDEEVPIALAKAPSPPPTTGTGGRRPAATGEVQQPDSPDAPDLPDLVADPYADDKNKPSKQLKDVAY